MAKVQFPNRVKYGTNWYEPYTPFECKDSDVACLIKDGAFVVEAPEAPIEAEVEVKEEVVDAPKEETLEVAFPTKSELAAMKTEELRKCAESLGVDISGLKNNESRIQAILNSKK